MFKTALFIITKGQKQPKSPSTDKQNVAHEGILFSLKKEGNFDICYYMDEPWRYYAKWSKPVRKRQILMIPLIWGSLDSLIQTERM